MNNSTALLCLERGGPSYPTLLDQIDGPPDKLWCRGQLRWLENSQRRIAIVGTRAPTPYGTAQAERFGRDLARAGIVVVSGLAQGIDQAAHHGALSVEGGTIAVLGSGLDKPWPRVPLVNQVATAGLLLSEHEPRVPPRPHHFPLRNRIISGLCDALLVIEAAAASGSLISARWAVDQGRDVFALPGRIDHPMSAGCHRLLREGAGLVESPAELMDLVFGAQGPSPVHRQEPPKRSPLECALVGETLSVDELVAKLARPFDELLVELVQLELANRVVRAPGGLYRLA